MNPSTYLSKNLEFLQEITSVYYRINRQKCQLASINEDDLFSDVVLHELPSILRRYDKKRGKLTGFVIHTLTSRLNRYVNKCIRAKSRQATYLSRYHTETCIKSEELLRIWYEQVANISVEARLFCTGHDIEEIVRITGKSKATVYRKLRELYKKIEDD